MNTMEIQTLSAHTMLWKSIKTDNGENDDYVTLREQDIKNGEKKSSWTNPLGWSDAGDDDDSVIAQLDSQINMSSHRC